MKIKTLKFSLIGLVVIALFLPLGCKKKTETPANTSQNDQTGTTEADAGMSDVNDYINNKIGGGANARVAATAAYNLPCGIIKVDSTTSGAITTYNLHYGGQTPCGYKYKSGQISFALVSGSSFSQQGAVVSITFISYTVTVEATGSVVILNGTIYDKNITGGYLWQVVLDDATVKHQLRGQLEITYANGAVRPVNYYQLRTWSSTGGWPGLSFSVAGDTAIGGYTSVMQTGNSYDNNYAYVTNASTPFLWSNCGTTYAGPYVLEQAEATMYLTVPGISPANIDIQGGYDWNYAVSSSTPALTQDCSSNAYKITLNVGSTTQTSYQLY